MEPIPEHIRSKIDPADLAKLPKGVRMSPEECSAAVEAKREIDMHNEFAGYLRLRKKVFGFVHADPSKPSRIRKGHPDFTVLYKANGIPKPYGCLIEFKMPGGKLSNAQIDCFGELAQAGIDIYVCTSVGDAILHLIEYFEIPLEQLTND